MAKSQEEKEYDLILSSTREILKSKQGQRVLWHILGLTGIYSTTFTGNSRTFFLEGKRAIGLDILQLLEDADKEAYARLQLAKIKQEK